jgi:aspartate racemase
MSKNGRQVWGIMGGMGPLASAEFVKTIYEFRSGECEQESPALILWSDASMPDRTECILSGKQDLLLDSLTESLWKLDACDVTSIIICCVTIHQIIDQLPDALRTKIISLLDVIFADLLKDDRRYILLCTTGTRQARLFESHALWDRAQQQLLLPSEEDQQRIHKLIYRVKQVKHQSEDIAFLQNLLVKYEADSLVLGCTEMHVLARTYGFSANKNSDNLFLDPLMILARRISQSVTQATLTR